MVHRRSVQPHPDMAIRARFNLETPLVSNIFFTPYVLWPSLLLFPLQLRRHR